MTEENTQGRVSWDAAAQENFQTILLQIPEMIRGIAEARVSKKAQSIVREDGRGEISEKDMIDAFFAETPSGFIPAMKTSMDDLKIDYKQYGHQ